MTELSARGLSKEYGHRKVVREVDLSVAQSEVVGLLGPNGAGKTTTFYMLLGIVKPTAGTVSLAGGDITNLPLFERARMGISYLPQEDSIFKKLTVRQNLDLVLEYTERNSEEQTQKAKELLEELGIAHISEQPAMHLSGGERRRLEIARALIPDPKFMILDEPFSGIDPLAVDDIQDIVVKLKSKGIGVLISDHNVRETLEICDRAYLVFEGRIILNGTPGEIVSDPRARRVYLGESFSL
ncbi:MAG: LPS export ABC transporter ATP-binding protein [Thermodesulfobacteriota bacterium]|nr:LPS export ABC transporter ATP-binding protein [Thermodesulfobacteriota bacterium]